MNSITATGTWNTTTNNQYSGFTAAGTTLTFSNQETMNQQQVKVAVFKVTRNKEGKVTSSTFLSEFWIEKKPGVSIDYAVAKQLIEDLSPDQIIIKEIYTLAF
jgi:hypothetical protein